MLRPRTRKNLSAKLRQSSPAFDYQEAFSRNIGLITPEEQERLRGATVAIPGCGGVGGIFAATLARMGVGRFKLADFDSYELANFNRQAGARISTIGRKKVEVIRNDILDINPEAVIDVFDEPIGEKNVDDFLGGAQVVCDGIDFFAFEGRITLFNAARRMGIPVLSGAPLGFSCALVLFNSKSMGIEQYFDFRPSDTLDVRCLKLVMGLAPKATHLPYMLKNARINFERRQGPSSAIGVTQSAALVCSEAVKLILRRASNVRAVPHSAQFDAYRLCLRTAKLRWGNRGPIQRLKIFIAKRLYAGIIRKTQSITDKRAALKVVAKSNAVAAPSVETMRRIIDAARWYPSGDNCQPFRFEWDGARLVVTHLKERGRHAMNFNNYGSYLALGALTEYLSIASRHHGYRSKIQLDLDDERECWARATFSPDEGGPDPLYGALFDRYTERRPFSMQAKDHWVLDRLEEISLIREFPKTFTDYYTEMERVVWVWKAAQQDLFPWIRFGKAGRTSEDGMPEEALGIGRIDRWGFRLLRSFRVQQMLNPLGFLRFISKVGQRNLLSSSAVGLVTVEDTERESIVHAGRRMVHAWLELDRAGFGLQPMTAASLFLYGFKTGTLPLEFPKRFLPTLERGAEVARETFRLNKNAIPVWMFRTGIVPDYPVAKARRLPLEKILTFK